MTSHALHLNGRAVKLAAALGFIVASACGTAQPLPLTADARQLLGWIADSGDQAGKPFVIIDKRAARLWAFDADLSPRGSTPVLLGLAVGDDSVPGIGARPLAKVLPHERTTPAGRFVLEPGRNLGGEDIFWVDYNAAVSMHRVRANVAAERRLERLASATVSDNRISYGCINVPADFYDHVLQPLLGTRAGTAYLLPETRPLASTFAALSAAEIALQQR